MFYGGSKVRSRFSRTNRRCVKPFVFKKSKKHTNYQPGPFMKNVKTFFVLVYTVISIILPLQAADYTDSLSYKELKPLPTHPRTAQLIMHILSRSHYRNLAIDDSLSSQMFDRYLESLDYNRSYFLQSDIDVFERYRYQLDDFLRSGNLSVAYQIYNKYQERFKERIAFIKKRIQEPFDFSKDETYMPDRRKAPWAKTSAELDEIWRKRLKNEALSMKLNDKEDDKIVETLLKRYRRYEKAIKQTESEDVFQTYMNAFTESFDPHTNYMSPKTSDDFKIRMSLSLERIGASLRTENDYTKVVEIVPGGPADKSGLLHANDLITAVGQGDDGEMVDIIGWRIDDVVQLIRGPKGTKVRLSIIPADASVNDPPKTIEIIRDEVKLEDRAAQSDTLEITHNGKNYKIGVIQIPAFYFDYEAMRKGDPNFKSTTRDVERLLGELQSAGVDGIIIDLRGNGGGFLNEAIELTGLFIDHGPVVQVRNSSGRVKVESDYDKGVVYDGPLAVMVDRLSASASEIFSAAIQDYRRGLVLGSQTFGKGTVQNVVKLGRFFPHSDQKYGQIKLTIAKFYRISGGSTQHVGVLPDITFPSRYSVMDIGEDTEDNALRWDEIQPANYRLYDAALKEFIPRLRKMHLARISQDREFRYLQEDIEELRKKKEEKVISLQLEKRKSERKLAEAKKEQRKKERGEDKNDHAKTFVLEEGGHVLLDLVLLQHDKLAKRK